MTRLPRQSRRIVTVLVDSNERSPLRFPAVLEYRRGGVLHLLEVHTLRKALALPGWGKGNQRLADYALAGAERDALVERKASVEELYGNLCSGDRGRAEAAFRRFAQAKHCLILIEQRISEFFGTTAHCPHPTQALDELLNILEGHPISFALVPPTRIVTAPGEFVLRWLLSNSWNTLFGDPS